MTVVHDPEHARNSTQGSDPEERPIPDLGAGAVEIRYTSSNIAGDKFRGCYLQVPLAEPESWLSTSSGGSPFTHAQACATARRILAMVSAPPSAATPTRTSLYWDTTGCPEDLDLIKQATKVSRFTSVDTSVSSIGMSCIYSYKRGRTWGQIQSFESESDAASILNGTGAAIMAKTKRPDLGSGALIIKYQANWEDYKHRGCIAQVELNNNNYLIVESIWPEKWSIDACKSAEDLLYMTATEQ